MFLEDVADGLLPEADLSGFPFFDRGIGLLQPQEFFRGQVVEVGLRRGVVHVQREARRRARHRRQPHHVGALGTGASRTFAVLAAPPGIYEYVVSVKLKKGKRVFAVGSSTPKIIVRP